MSSTDPIILRPLLYISPKAVYFGGPNRVSHSYVWKFIRLSPAQSPAV